MAMTPWCQGNELTCRWAHLGWVQCAGGAGRSSGAADQKRKARPSLAAHPCLGRLRPRMLLLRQRSLKGKRTGLQDGERGR